MGTSGAMARMASTSYQQANAPFQAALNLQQQAYNQEADLYDQQAQIALDEAGRDAEIKARDAEKFRAQQALNYSASGVLLEGSPMEVLNETRRLASQEIDATLARGGAQADLLRQRAMQTRTVGRASLLGEQAKYTQQATQARIQEINNRGTGVPGLIGSILSSFGGALISKGITGGKNPFAKTRQPGLPPIPPPTNTYGILQPPIAGSIDPSLVRNSTGRLDPSAGDYGIRKLLIGGWT